MDSSLLRAVGLCAGLSAVLALSASAADTGFYFNAEGGVNFAHDIDIGGSTLDMEPGIRAGVGLGYNLTKCFGVEFDTGWIWNKVEDRPGLTGDISLSHLPFMINGVYRYENSSKWVPYIGVGAGGTYSVLDIDANGLDDSDADVAFAWQVLAGVRYMFRENMSVGAGYKYLGTTDSTYTFNGADVKLNNVHNHSINVVFQLLF